MGLLDNLFKPKPESGGEKSAEISESDENSPQQAAESPATGTPQHKHPAFLAPKIYVPRSSVQIVPPARTQPAGERILAPVAAPSAAPKEIVLTLGDVLSRIPEHLLRHEKPDLRRELRFPADGLAADIARGRAAVALSAIIAQCPDVFVFNPEGIDGIQIRLPLQKLVEQISLGSFVPNPAAATRPAPAPVAAPLEIKPAPAAVGAPPVMPGRPAAQGEEQIHLSLAAIMKRCPAEIIVKPLPPIDDSVRVSFPFPPVERQLSSGQVEVSSLRFIAALPLDLMKCFEARAGVKVPLPLEEIFQNLPAHPAPSTPLPAIEAVSEAIDIQRENTRLAEEILLEPIPEPVAETRIFPEPVPQENVVVSASFSTDAVLISEPPPAVVIPEPEPAPVVKISLPVPEAAAPEIVVVAPAPPEEIVIESASPDPEEADASIELTATLEALAAEDAKVDSQEADAVLLDLLPEIQPPPAPSPIVTEPMPPVSFRPFAPPIRTPVILQSQSSPEELRPAVLESAPAPAVAAPEPVAPVLAAQTRIPPFAFPPDAARLPVTGPILPAPAEPVTQEQAPVDLHLSAVAPVVETPPPPIATEASNFALRIGPPQFRPFIVQPPRIVLAPTSEIAAVPEPPPEPPPAPAAAPAPIEPVAATPPVEIAPVAEPEPEPLPPPAPPSAPSAEIHLDGRVREFFPSENPLAIPHVSQLLAQLPGIQSAVLATRTTRAHTGELPEGLDPAAIYDLSRKMRGALSDSASPFHSHEVQHLTLHSEQYSLTLFTRGEACVCAIHRARIFLPGVRERFSAVAEELARASD